MPNLDRRGLLRAGLGGAAGVLAAPTLARAQGGSSVLNVALLGEAPSLDPAIFTNDVASVISQHFFETLYTFDQRWAVAPLLAASLPEVSADGRTYTIPLRTDVMFHDGARMSAADVVPSVQRWARDSPRGKLAGAVLESVTAQGDAAVVLTLKQPFAPLLPLLAMNNGAAIIIPKAVAEAASGPIKTFVGTGPYRFVDYRPDQFVRVRRHDGYASPPGEPSGYAGRRTAHVEEIRFLPVPNATTRVDGMLSGQFQFAENLPTEMFDRLSRGAGVKPFPIEPSWITFLITNTRSGPLANPLLRQAIQAALNTEDMLAAGFGDPRFFKASGSIYADGTAFHSSDIVGYNQADLKKAAALLKQAGYKGEPIRILTSQQFDYLYKMALVARESLTEAGFTIDVQVMDWASLTQRRENPQAWEAFTSLHAFVPEPSLLTFINPAYAGWWDTPEKRAALQEFNQETDPARRVQRWQRLQQLQGEQAATIMIGQYSSIAAVSDRLKNFVPQPWQSFWNVQV